jgi:hypothetical protein
VLTDCNISFLFNIVTGIYQLRETFATETSSLNNKKKKLILDTFFEVTRKNFSILGGHTKMKTGKNIATSCCEIKD